MRVLQISHYFPPELHGGTQSYVEALARKLVADGDEVRVLAGSAQFLPGGGESRQAGGGFEVLRLHRDQASEFFSGDLGSERLLAASLAEARAFAPDLVHLHHWHGLSRGLVAALTEAGFYVVVTLHDLFVSCPRHFRMPDARRFCARETSLADCASCIAPDLPQLDPAALEIGLGERREVFRHDLARAERVLGVSRAQADFIASLPGFEDLAIEVMPIGTPPLEPVAAPAPRPDRLRLVNWAGLDPRKGPQVLLQAIAATAAPEAFELSLLGRPGHAEFMRELHELAAGLDVDFAGEFEDDERARQAALSDVAVMPYLAFETYALTVDEAMHLGLPVVVSDRGAPKERVGGRGLVVPADNIEALAAALDRLRLDPDLLTAMRAAPSGARFLDEHFLELFALYREVATRSRG